MTDKEIWALFCKAQKMDITEYEAWAFGGAPDKLADLVLQGIKTGTSSAFALYEAENEILPQEESYSVILDSANQAKCIIKTTKVYVVPFREVEESHAYKEGEGDRSLAYWRRVHKEFFSDCLINLGMLFDENMKVVCEEFELVYKP